MARVKARSSSSNPAPLDTRASTGSPHCWDGEDAPSIQDPKLRAAFARAHYEWAKARASWLLEEWLR